MVKKKSFFERLTGAINTEDEAFIHEDHHELHPKSSTPAPIHIDHNTHDHKEPEEWKENDPEPAELPVYVHHTDEDIILKTIIAGIPPEELDVSITHEMVSISGSRNHHDKPESGDVIHDELYWGPFTRTVRLPEEVDIELAEANEWHGMLTIKLPKIDKKRKTKLEIKSHS